MTYFVKIVIRNTNKFRNMKTYMKCLNADLSELECNDNKHRTVAPHDML